MAFEVVTVVAAGAYYSGWENCIVIWDGQSPYSTFQLQTTELNGKKLAGNPFDEWNFPPGTPVQIYGGNDPLISGFINVYAPFYDEGQHSVTVTGETMGRTFADSSVRHPTGNFENMTDVGIISEFAASAGVTLRNMSVASLIPSFQIRQGATNYAEAMRILQQRAKMLMSALPDGELVITDGTGFEVITTGALVEAENITKASARLSAESFFTYEVVGQAPFGSEDLKLEPFGIAYDLTRASTRYKKIVDQGISSPQLAQLRANWERARANGASTQATITTPGWRDTGGRFWQPNSDVYVYSPWLKIDCWMRTYKIVWSQDLGTGTSTTITLVDPQTLLGQSLACKSDSLWTPQWKGGGD